MKYNVIGQGGEKEKASSLREAKRIAKQMARPRFGSNPRLFWNEWCDGTLIADPKKGYNGDNPMVAIRKN